MSRSGLAAGQDRLRCLVENSALARFAGMPSQAIPRDGRSEGLLKAAAGGTGLLLRQLFDVDSGTFTYLIADALSGEGLLIDPVYDQHRRDLALIRELGIDLLGCLDTHAHADHVTGSWRMAEACGAWIALAAVIGARNVNRPLGHGDRLAFGGRHLPFTLPDDGSLGDVDLYLQGLVLRGDGSFDLSNALELRVSGTNLLDKKIKQHAFGDIIERKLSASLKWRF